MDGKGANAKLVLGNISFQTKCMQVFHQTKCMQDMDGKGANAKLVLGTIS
jgi:hypothetical protein